MCEGLRWICYVGLTALQRRYSPQQMAYYLERAGCVKLTLCKTVEPEKMSGFAGGQSKV